MNNEYAKQMGAELNCAFAGNELQVFHLSTFYDQYGIRIEEMNKYVKEADKTGGMLFLISIPIRYLTSFESTKYYTTDKDGNIDFWNYDFNTFFPVEAFPQIILFNSTTEQAERVLKIVLDLYSEGKEILVQHPVIPDAYIPFTLIVDKSIGEKKGFITYNAKTIQINCFKKAIVPWSLGSINKEAIEDEKRKQIAALKEVQGLFAMSDFIKSKFHSEDIGFNAREIFTTITNNRISKLEALEIPQSVWDIGHIEQIGKRLVDKSDNRNLWEIVDEIVQKEEQEEEKKNMEAMRILFGAKNSVPANEGNTYYDYTRYADSTSSDGIWDFAKDVMSSFIGNRGVEKAIRQQTEYMKEQDRQAEKRRREERQKEAAKSRAEYHRVLDLNKERARKGLPPLPLPRVDWY